MNYVIIGNGPTGVIAAETLRGADPAGKVILVGDEPEPPYSRMAIPYLLMADIQEEGTYLRKDKAHFQSLGIQMVQGRAKSLDTGKRQVTLEDGKAIAYDRLLIASGSRPVAAPIPGILTCRACIPAGPWRTRVGSRSSPRPAPACCRWGRASSAASSFDHHDAQGGIGAFEEPLQAYRVLYDKDAIRRIDVPLGFDAAGVTEAEYAAFRPELDQLEVLLADSPPTAAGLRWREIEGATVFEFQRELPIPFELFVDRVDVARTIQFMNDYIGGVVVPTQFDDRGRVVRQAERNLYLPQPNYLVLYQGRPIDVSKIECCDYADDEHRMYWKTIKSENQSAVHDDGVVSFTRTLRGTLVRVLGRQLFTLPPFWQAALSARALTGEGAHDLVDRGHDGVLSV